MNIRLFLLVPFLILSACATPKSTIVLFQPVQTIPANKALVYFYRPNAHFNNAGWADLFIDGEKKFSLVNNSYGYVFLDEGEYEIKFEGSTWGTNWWPGPAIGKVSVNAGQEYFVRIEPLEPGMISEAVSEAAIIGGVLVLAPAIFSNNSKAQTEIRQVGKSQALNEIRRTTLIEQ